MPKQTKSIEQLRQELKSREAELSTLQKQRATVEKVLVSIDEQIAALLGEAVPARGRKPKKGKRGRKAGATIQKKGKWGRPGKKQAKVLKMEAREIVVQTAASEEAGATRYTGKAVRALRKKLNLSQEKFGNLVGVSPQTVYQWERKSGGLTLRKATQDKLAKAWTSDSSKTQKPAKETKQEKKPVKKTTKKIAMKKKATQKEQPKE